MGPNPLLGVVFHWLGGLASGSFYVPYRRVKIWAWETYWLVGGFFSWILAPWILALWMTSDLTRVLGEAPSGSLFWAYTFGVLWGLGGLTFGLTMRYLGMSLGMAVALGYTAAFGTLMPPIFRGQFAREVLGTSSGLTILTGVGICLLGILFAGMAGISKEKEMSDAQTRVHQRVRPKKGVARRYVLRSDERVLRLWTGRRRPHQRDYGQTRDAVPLAGPPRFGDSPAGGIHHQCDLVRDLERSKRDGISILYV